MATMTAPSKIKVSGNIPFTQSPHVGGVTNNTSPGTFTHSLSQGLSPTKQADSAKTSAILTQKISEANKTLQQIQKQNVEIVKSLGQTGAIVQAINRLEKTLTTTFSSSFKQLIKIQEVQTAAQVKKDERERDMKMLSERQSFSQTTTTTNGGVGSSVGGASTGKSGGAGGIGGMLKGAALGALGSWLTGGNIIGGAIGGGVGGLFGQAGLGAILGTVFGKEIHSLTKNLLSGLGKLLKPVGDKIWSGIKHLGSFLGGVLQDVGKLIWNTMKSVGKWIYEKMKPVLDPIVNGIRWLKDNWKTLALIAVGIKALELLLNPLTISLGKLVGKTVGKLFAKKAVAGAAEAVAGEAVAGAGGGVAGGLASLGATLAVWTAPFWAGLAMNKIAKRTFLRQKLLDRMRVEYAKGGWAFVRMTMSPNDIEEVQKDEDELAYVTGSITGEQLVQRLNKRKEEIEKGKKEANKEGGDADPVVKSASEGAKVSTGGETVAPAAQSVQTQKSGTSEQGQEQGQKAEQFTPLQMTGTSSVFMAKNRWVYTHGKRSASDINAIVVHHTGSSTISSAVYTLHEREDKVGYHYLIDVDGAIYQMCSDLDIVYHCGTAKGGDRGTGITNRNSIGVSCVALENKFVNSTQIAKAISLIKSLMSKYGVPLNRVVGHGDVSSKKMRDEGYAVLNVLKGAGGGELKKEENEDESDGPLVNKNYSSGGTSGGLGEQIKSHWNSFTESVSDRTKAFVKGPSEGDGKKEEDPNFDKQGNWKGFKIGDKYYGTDGREMSYSVSNMYNKSNNIVMDAENFGGKMTMEEMAAFEAHEQQELMVKNGVKEMNHIVNNIVNNNAPSQSAPPPPQPSEPANDITMIFNAFNNGVA